MRNAIGVCGRFEINSFENLKTLFASSELYPNDLKKCVAETLSSLLKPLHDKFAEPDKIELIGNAFST